MPKDSFQDVVPPKKTIRDIPIPDHRKGKHAEETSESVAASTHRYSSAPSHHPPPPPPPPAVYAYGDYSDLLSFIPKFPRSMSTKKIVLTLSAAAALGGLLYLGQFLLPKAEVIITPKKIVVSVDDTFTARQDGISGNDLQFELMKLSKEEVRVVPETGVKTIEKKASGTIIVYNDYSSASQRLIKNTRFETPDGKVYRVNTSIVVPGKKGSAPGSVEAEVFADAAGEAYNLNAADFTIPGFKGDPRYGKFYARSKTPLSGGFVGTVKTASPVDIEKAKSELSASLKEQLLLEAASQKPQGYVLYKNAIYTETETLSNPESNEVKERVTLYGVIFDEKKLSQYLAYRKLSGSDYHGEEISGGESLANLFFETQGGGKPWESNTFAFSLDGELTLSFVVDQEKLKNSLAGVPKKEITGILQAYPMDRGSVSIQPFWRGSVPEDPADIEVVFKD